MEEQLLEEIKRLMREKGISQADFANHKDISRQAVNKYFTGRVSLLNQTGIDLLEFLGVRIKLEPNPPAE